MPKLLEVKTIKRVIAPQIQELTIERVQIRRQVVVAPPATEAFFRKLAGQTVSGLERWEKFLRFRLTLGGCAILHLWLTGCLLPPAEMPEEKHTHLILAFSSGREPHFSDTRRFGRFWLLQDGEADTYSGIAKLGKEPFDADVFANYLRALLGRRKRPSGNA